MSRIILIRELTSYPKLSDCLEGVDLPELFSGRTPLSVALWWSTDKAEIVRTLLQTGLIDVNKKCRFGALHKYAKRFARLKKRLLEGKLK